MEDHQHTWYNSGIGTYARPHWRSLHFWKQVADHKIDLAIAWYVCLDYDAPYACLIRSGRHFEKTLLEAYRWLVDNYQDGDCIFLFGKTAFQMDELALTRNRVLARCLSSSRSVCDDRKGEQDCLLVDLALMPSSSGWPTL